ncbi:uncharacterized protein KD926_005945 [Aspergillus affinis]|uniref:uncharacterized protein n=1 Tax=Aspergillus affinis TaxID=1070780 RepID=UPI0022FE3642|nr:uncharacterized protein KD926_005945 [Aspergillus affinis]KAI9046000.1 hypothetical protein KD926_005945 [Aspergillus affinis]
MADHRKSLTGVSWAFASVSIIVVAIRVYTRALYTRRAGWDDFFIALSLISALVCSALVQVGVSYGLGMHATDITDPEAKIQAFKYTVIAPNFSMVSTTTGKISVVIFLLRLMGPTASAWRRWFLYILTVVSIGMNILAVIVVMGFCRPAEKIWRPETPGSCFSLQLQLVAGTAQASYNAFSDLALAIFPVFVFWKVQLAMRLKVAVIAVMGAGVFAAAATLTKAILLKNLPAHADITWSWAPITIWYTIEMYVIIICATLPTLRQSYFAVLNRSTHQSSSYNKFTHSAKSDQKQRSIPQPRRPVDASLFETHLTNFQEEPSHHHSSSQEDILPGEAIDLSAIKKTTEVHVYQESRTDNSHDNPFDPFSEEAAKYDTEESHDVINDINWDDPSSFFEKMNLNLPKPLSYPCAEEGRKESRERSSKVLSTWQTLSKIIDRHEDRIQKRWRQKSQPKRRQVLLSVWPDMPKMHRPDFQAFKKGLREEAKDSYMWPYINLEDLEKPRPLLLFLNARARQAPHCFAHADFNAQHLGHPSGAIRTAFLNLHTMMFSGGTTPESRQTDKAFTLFLLETCYQPLHDIPRESLIDDFPVLPEPTIKDEKEWASLAAIAGDAPYCLPASLDLRSLEDLVDAKHSAAEDHLLALREDPGYFEDVVSDYKEHRLEILLDITGKLHPTMAPHPQPLFWNCVLQNVVAEAYFAVET